MRPEIADGVRMVGPNGTTGATPKQRLRFIQAYSDIPSGQGRTTMLVLLRQCAGSLLGDSSIQRVLREIVPARIADVRLRPEQCALIEAYRAIPNAAARKQIVEYISQWEMEGQPLNEPLA